VSEERTAAQIELGVFSSELAEIRTARTRIQTKKQAMQALEYDSDGMDDYLKAGGFHQFIIKLNTQFGQVLVPSKAEREKAEREYWWQRAIAFHHYYLATNSSNAMKRVPLNAAHTLHGLLNLMVYLLEMERE
jgi:hypothetical protein